ncbi:GNAT family N-acetyltransferase [Nocardioides mesophilus]|uniref:GNAT family N-acetyltransferase n=1 Tax=Nocardioides mesophilus TaxID=433659 RepID=A0A7G9RCK7_9ACTN|nr:GNAT family N-acetyltransferase [Nocardioides mesophilus]QNN53332.1 GNAT family N-acetyltransferase [Nocardioides mesophilus]
MPSLSDLLITRIDPLELDLATADGIAEVLTASSAAAGLGMPPRSGAAALLSRQLQSDGTPVDGLWVATVGDRVIGHLDLELPAQENTDSAHLRGNVHPELRGHGVGRALLEEGVRAATDAGRAKLYTGAFSGGDGIAVLERWGFTATPGRYAVRRVDLHEAPHGLWDRLYDEAAGHAADYELVHLVGPTPPGQLEQMATLHEAINDAPADDEDEEPALFDAERVRRYDAAMAGRRQTVHRVVAVHRSTGEWAGLSMLCVDEFGPGLAFQEDTSVVRAHRGHRLGLLMKADMLRWISRERPEVGAVDTWNATSNHHMIAVNERLGAQVVAEHVGYRRDL